MNQNNPNVLAINFNLAGMIGTQSFGVRFYLMNHIIQTHILLNMVHVHAFTKPGVLGITHIFYLV